MSEQERNENEKQLVLVFQQLHLSVIYESSFLQTLSKQELNNFRDTCLDKIIFFQKKIGIRQ